MKKFNCCGGQRRLAWLSGGLLVLAAAFQAQAQDLPRAENPAADHFVARGIELRAQGKDQEALQAFRQAEALDPSSVRVQVHLATVYQALGDWLVADEYLSRALAQQNHPYINRHRQVLEDAKRVIDSNIGRVEVEGEPAGAEVYLSGRALGSLPLKEPVRWTVGSYLLEVRSPGHYPLRRPIVIVGGGLVRESVQLQPLPSEEGWRGSAGAGTTGIDEAPSDRAWLTWTLAGAATVGAAVTVGAWTYREVHADHWNDDSRCLDVGRSRAEVCGDERDNVNTADTVAWVSGTLTGLFALGAVVNAFAFQPAAPEAAGLEGCSLGWAGASCFGRF
ncbi:MAG TPA: tetratricopeptide repeat protein [Polyangiaceae bacterium]|nr:tetratricopeptide repeat protein [Polyangiaceae bacterium]